MNNHQTSMSETIANQHVKTIRELLGIESGFIPLVADFVKAPAPLEVPAGLPIAPPAVHEETRKTAKTETAPAAEVLDYEARPLRLLARDYVRYPLIFLVALAFFFGLLNFSAISTQVARLFNPPASEKKEVSKKENVDAYNKWIKKYYIYAADSKTLEFDQDPDGDSLTNREEFHLGTNPFKPDTDGDGADDGDEVLDGLNPLYLGEAKTSQEQEIDQNIDVDIVQSRKDAEEFKQVAGRTGEAGLPIGETFAVDITKPGNIQIPKLGIDLAIIWTADFKKIQDDLKYGAAHHPQTVYPGERGTSSIHGHSSGDPWDGNFKTAFTKINFLEEGDDVFVTEYGPDGQTRRLHYAVRSKQVFEKNDQGQFKDLGGYFLNLSTSWPIGTAYKRYVVTTELVGL